jgi:hypothetical protein
LARERHAGPMPRRPHVPESLRGRPLTVSDAQAHGITRRALGGPGWRRVLRGVYVDADTVIDDPLRVRALRLVMPDDVAAFGLTAAWLHGAWQPPPQHPLPLHLSVPTARCRPGRAPDGGHRSQWWDGDVVEVHGVRATAVMRTAFDLMRHACLVEAVSIADSFAYQELLDPLAFAVYVDGHRRWPGVNHCRQAIALSSPLARSAGESRLRMVAVLGGLPEPLVNPPYYRNDELIGYPDLLLMGPRDRWAGLEYDGAYHLDPAQRTADLRRENRFVMLGTLPILRYDRNTVARHSERLRALQEMGHAIGVRSHGQLPRGAFYDARRPVRW